MSDEPRFDEEGHSVRRAAPRDGPGRTGAAADDKAPLGFKLLVTAAAAYLLLRLGQGVVWFVEWLR